MNNSLANKLFEAQCNYYQLHSEMEDAIYKILGTDPEDVESLQASRVFNITVENDSAHDCSVEVKLVNNEKLTENEIAQIKALGFVIVWNREDVPEYDDIVSTTEKRKLLAELNKLRELTNLTTLVFDMRNRNRESDKRLIRDLVKREIKMPRDTYEVAEILNMPLRYVSELWSEIQKQDEENE